MAGKTVTPVFQFGTSRFLQAHAALFIHEALEAGEAAGPITVVAVSGSTAGRTRLHALARPEGFPVVVRGLQGGVTVHRKIQVRSIRRALDAENDWHNLAELFAEQAEFVVSNTTEAGLTLLPDQTLDLTRLPARAPSGYPAKLLMLLAHRFICSAAPVTMLPTELVPRNGDILRQAILELARRSGASDDLLTFIGDDCVFANSLVDRIVSSALTPAGAVTEPYALWAVESQPCLQLPARHAAIVPVSDLEPTERLKLHILNLGHTVLAHHWRVLRLRDNLTVREMLGMGEFRHMLGHLYRAEVIPGFASRGMASEAESYVATTMERFDNPYLDHRLSDIAVGHFSKVGSRISGFLDWVRVDNGCGYRGLMEIVGGTDWRQTPESIQEGQERRTRPTTN